MMLVREPIVRAASHYLYFREKRRAFRTANLSQVLQLEEQVAFVLWYLD